MLLALTVLVAAVAVGLLRGGRLDGLGRLDLRRRPLVVAAVLAQLAGTLLGGPSYAVGLSVSALLVGWFLVVNRGTRGTGLVALGLLANALVVGANGAMPVSLDAAARARIPTGAILAGDDPRHEAADRATRLRPLGDVVPVLLPLAAEVVSPGDVLVAAGLGQLVVVGMGAGRSSRVQPLRQPSPGGTMAKKGRKRRARKKSAANHGKRPNA